MYMTKRRKLEYLGQIMRKLEYFGQIEKNLGNWFSKLTN